MNNVIDSLLAAIFIGLGATLTFDVWSLFLRYAFKITPSNFCLVGRWLRTMPEGIFKHSSIASAPRKSAECTIGWIAHYGTGVLFAVAFLALASNHWLQRPKLIPAIVFGIVTVLAPFLIMQPAFGYGVAASKTPNPVEAMLRSLMNHAVFGIGIYLFGLLLSWLLWV